MNNPNTKFSLLTFLYRPAHSMRQLLGADKGHTFALLLAAIFGIVQFSRLLPVKSRRPEELLLHLVLCGFCGVVLLFLFGWLIRNFGRWFDAKTEQREVRTALGLGVLPWTVLFATLFLMLHYGVDTELIANKYFPVFLGTFVYGFCIFLLSLTAALRLGVVKTFFCIVITILFSIFPLTLLAQALVSYLK